MFVIIVNCFLHLCFTR